MGRVAPWFWTAAGVPLREHAHCRVPEVFLRGLNWGTKLRRGHYLAPRKWLVADLGAYIDGTTHNRHERDPASSVRTTFTVLVEARLR